MIEPLLIVVELHCIALLYSYSNILPSLDTPSFSCWALAGLREHSRILVCALLVYFADPGYAVYREKRFVIDSYFTAISLQYDISQCATDSL